MSTKPQELNKVIADLRQIIVGKVAMPTDQIEQITLFLFLKQLSRKHDDLVRIGSKELIFTGAWERYHFDVLMRHGGEELVKECREAVESLYKNPHIDATVRKVFERSYLKILEPKVLSSFLQYLNDKFSDGLDLGDFYESLLPILGTQNELGQFRTPRHIIDFIVRVVDPNIGEKIADPACGTAGFLVAAFNYLKEKYTDEKGRLKLNPEQTKKLYNETIFGWDMEPLMVKFSLANLYLHGLKVPNVTENDTLINENLWQHTFDIIVANPPFITPKGGARRHSRFAITSNKTEVLFCEYMVHHLNFNGRMGVIVPEGIIFDTNKGHQAIRKLFLDNGLWCVVSLPQKVFNPYSPVKTSVVFLDKTLQPEQILFYDVENHGFTLNTNPAPINKNDLPNALKIIKKFREDLQNGKQSQIDEEKYYTIPKQKILDDNTINLAGSTHKIKSELKHEEHEIVGLGKIINLDFGVRITKKNDTGTKYPVYGGGGESFRTDKYNRENDWVISRFAMSENCVRFVNEKFFLLDSGFTFSVKDEYKKSVSKKYIASILLSIQNQIYAISRGEAQRNIDVAKFKALKIPLPTIKIQEQIVAELESYQRVIDGARAVVEGWKPNFEIDPKWEKVKISEVCEDLFAGGDVPKNNYSLEKSEKYQIPIYTNGINDKSLYGYTNTARVEKESVTISARGTIGYSEIRKPPFYPAVRLIVAIPNQKKIDVHFLKYSLDTLNIYKTGNSIPQLTIPMISNEEIYLAPINKQKDIVARIQEEEKLVEANKKLIDLFLQKIEAKIKSIYG